MKPAAFDYHSPKDLPDALALLSEFEEARILAGGQSLVPMMNYRLAQPKHLVDINRIAELDFIREEDGKIVIGALVRHNAVQSSALIIENLPLIAHAYAWIAHTAVRNRGTLCGNLCHADPASEMPALIQVLEAEMVVASAAGSRRVPATEFFCGTYETALRAGEMLTEIRIPKPGSGTGWGFEEVSMRKGDFAWAALGCTLRLEGGLLTDVRIAAAGVGDCAIRLTEMEAALNGQLPSTGLFKDGAAAAAEKLAPPDTASVSAEYRLDLIRALVPRVLQSAVERTT